ncbi:MAG TPA: hypothetical protein VF618_22600 [Thermoanaerobaculia bacterium]
MILALFLLVTATIQPPAPAVGDLITVDFENAPVLDKSTAYEVVAQQGKRVVVRTFEPKPFTITGTTGGVRFADVVVPVRSVLPLNDPLTPAPLKPPREAAMPRRPFVAIGLAALAALLAWLAVYLRSRRRVDAPVVPALPPQEQFRRTVLTLRDDPRAPRRWAALADATRAYLAATQPHLGAELTTTEVCARLSVEQGVVTEILRQGDYEKFSPWGAPLANFDAIADRALALIPVEREVAA